ncbi:TerC family protein [Silvanigrella aquatica]|uniref:Tellurium resistance protein TerC n=1 Tax=Silvanigrella aquatica TaxID=1915309 RepID=A0A1L4CWV7_9BACT|nr:TerC family protein [Silvanigrella aquatica]APJ02426.1 hypothetical protein AXG55_00125 [Silvanigrella aquatica]
MPEPNFLVTFLVLMVLEFILGFDNVLMISIISQRVAEEKQKLIQFLGLTFAALNRIALVFFISWFTSLSTVLFYINNLDITIKDLIFFIGGAFLIWKSFKEIYYIIEYKKSNMNQQINKTKKYSFLTAIFQIIALDAVFSIDSVITAIGFTENVVAIILAILLSVFFMMFYVNKINIFIKNNASIKILALGFMFVIGVVLFLEVFDAKIPKYYLGVTLVFALIIQLLQLRYQENKKKFKKRSFIRTFYKKVL